MLLFKARRTEAIEGLRSEEELAALAFFLFILVAVLNIHLYLFIMRTSDSPI